VGKASIQQIAAQFALEIAEAPSLEVFEHATAQEAIRRDAGAAGAGGFAVTASEAMAHQVDELVVIEQVVDGIQQVVLEQSHLLSQGSEKEERLVLSGGDHLKRVYRLR